jgi:hypothetical protein
MAMITNPVTQRTNRLPAVVFRVSRFAIARVNSGHLIARMIA